MYKTENKRLGGLKNEFRSYKLTKYKIAISHCIVLSSKESTVYFVIMTQNMIVYHHFHCDKY